MISLRTHNILDYIVGSVLVFAPWIFGFSAVAAARNTFVISGALLILYSLVTRYEYSVAKVIPVKTHMLFDLLIGFVVLVSPWLFGYSGLITTAQIYVPIVMGVGAFALVTFTDRQTPIGRDSSRTYDIGRAA